MRNEAPDSVELSALIKQMRRWKWSWEGDPEDAIATTLLKLVEAKWFVKTESKDRPPVWDSRGPTAYAYQARRRVAIDAVRRAHARPRIADGLVLDDLESSTRSMGPLLDGLSRSARNACLRNDLEPVERLVEVVRRTAPQVSLEDAELVVKHHLGHSYRELADATGKREGTLAERVSQTKKRIRASVS